MSKLKSCATLNVRQKTVGRRIFPFTSSKQYHISDLFKDAWHLQGVYVKCHQETRQLLQETVDLTLCEVRLYLQKQQEEFCNIK